MFEMQVKGTFDAAHQIKGYQGKCRRLHGHTWQVAMEVRGSVLDELGMLLDFRELNQTLKDCLAPLDHQNLSEMEPFQALNPTAENIAKYLYERLAEQPIFQQERARLYSVCVWESAHSSVRYYGDAP